MTNISSEELFTEWLKEGWRFRAKTHPYINEKRNEYAARVKYESDLIISKDFVDYFLMLSDVVRWAKDRGIMVGPGRGSVVASLVAWLLRISEVDPMLFPSMMFERFIDVTRNDPPDIDLDFDNTRREEIFEYLVNKYGTDCVGNVGTSTRYRGKNSLADVARVYRIPEYTVKPIKDLLIQRPDAESRYSNSIEDTLAAFPEVQEYFEEYPELHYASQLEGNIRSNGTHPAGIIIGNGSLTNTVATYERVTGTGNKKKIRQVCSVDKYDAEYLGLIKADFLGLKTMGMIGEALELIGDVSLNDLYALPLDDEKVMQAFRNNDVAGIFQFTGGATRTVNKEVQPDVFMHLADISTLSRPGPLYSGSTKEYIDTKHNRMQIEKIQPIYDEIVSQTYGQIIYQEQIMRIVRELGGFDWEQTTAIRKIIQRKMGEASFAKWLQLFIQGCGERGITETQAKAIWSRIVTAGSYVFNIPHSVSYAMIAYYTMWLKVYYPIEFYTACLRRYKDDDYQFVLMRDALQHGIEVQSPSMVWSDIDWRGQKEGSGLLRAGFSQLPGVGESVAATIVKHREEYQGTSLGLIEPSDLLKVKGFGDKKMEKIYEFYSTNDPFEIYKVDKIMSSVRKALPDFGLPIPTHKANEIPASAADLHIVFLGLPTQRDIHNILEDERTASGEELEAIIERTERPDLAERAVLKLIDDTDMMVFARINRFKYPKFKKAIESLDMGNDAVLVVGRKSMGLGLGIRVDNLWIISND